MTDQEVHLLRRTHDTRGRHSPLHPGRVWLWDRVEGVCWVVAVLVWEVLMETAEMALNVVNSACVQRRLGLEVVSQRVE